MAVKVDGIHHRNPSGFHNKVNWLMSESRHDIYSFYALSGKIAFTNCAWLEAFNLAMMLLNGWNRKAKSCFPKHARWIEKKIKEIEEYEKNGKV